MSIDRINSHWPAPSKEQIDAFKPSRIPAADGWWIDGDWAQHEDGRLVIYRKPPIAQHTDNGGIPDLSNCLVNW